MTSISDAYFRKYVRPKYTTTALKVKGQGQCHQNVIISQV